MTPDKARDLLDGTTPGPWGYYSPRGKDGHYDPVFGDVPGDEIALVKRPADWHLIASAPVLAAVIAGMREEWGVTCEEVAGPTTFTYSEWADSAGKLLTHHTARLLAWEKVRAGYPNVRIVRRYVTEPEEA